MNDARESFFRDQLIARRQRIEAAMAEFKEAKKFTSLLRDIDAALQRLNNGTYGICEQCHDPIEAERLMADPLVCYCIDHLTTDQKRALEYDLELATRIQQQLLPKRYLQSGSWEIAYHYESTGPVSGDYCDVIIKEHENELYTILGDVSGKGVAASMLMTHLHALFRSLTTLQLPVDHLLEHANRLFCESTLTTYFATLAIFKLTPNGTIEIGNAGHHPPFIVRDTGVEPLEATGIPLGIISNYEYTTHKSTLNPGESIILYSDGISETLNETGEEYGTEGLIRAIKQVHTKPLPEIINFTLHDVRTFRRNGPTTDDQTVMIIRRSG